MQAYCLEKYGVKNIFIERNDENIIAGAGATERILVFGSW